MKIVQEDKNGGSYLTLPAKLALPQSVELKEHLLNAVSKDHDVVIDCKNVQDIKTPFIQILIAGARYFQRCKKSMKVQNLASSVEGAFIDLGLTDELNRVKGI
ncbi:MAG: hypothetical protein ACRBBN_01560 [Methyloligellaceae bacterium]